MQLHVISVQPVAVVIKDRRHTRPRGTRRSQNRLQLRRAPSYPWFGMRRRCGRRSRPIELHKPAQIVVVMGPPKEPHCTIQRCTGTPQRPAVAALQALAAAAFGWQRLLSEQRPARYNTWCSRGGRPLCLLSHMGRSACRSPCVPCPQMVGYCRPDPQKPDRDGIRDCRTLAQNTNELQPRPLAAIGGLAKTSEHTQTCRLPRIAVLTLLPPDRCTYPAPAPLLGSRIENFADASTLADAAARDLLFASTLLTRVASDAAHAGGPTDRTTKPVRTALARPCDHLMDRDPRLGRATTRSRTEARVKRGKTHGALA